MVICYLGLAHVLVLVVGTALLNLWPELADAVHLQMSWATDYVPVLWRKHAELTLQDQLHDYPVAFSVNLLFAGAQLSFLIVILAALLPHLDLRVKAPWKERLSFWVMIALGGLFMVDAITGPVDPGDLISTDLFRSLFLPMGNLLIALGVFGQFQGYRFRRREPMMPGAAYVAPAPPAPRKFWRVSRPTADASRASRRKD